MVVLGKLVVGVVYEINNFFNFIYVNFNYMEEYI